jgi:hypothetical protein
MLGLTSPLQSTDRSAAELSLRSRPALAAISWRALLVAALLSVLAGAALSLGLTRGSSSLSGERPSQSSAMRAGDVAHRGLSSLPLTTQAPISAALGADDRAYHVAGSSGILRATSATQGLRAGFQRSGVRLSSAALDLGLSLRAIGYGSALGALGKAQPHASANRVTYDRPALSEWYVNGPAGLEQGFTLAHPPSPRSSGPLTLALRVSGNGRAALAAGAQALTFSNGSASLRYGGLRSIDASGRALHTWLEVHGATVLLRVDATGARYPLTVDPLIQLVQHGSKITGGGEQGEGRFGISVALSQDGSTALIGAPYDDNLHGAAWVFTRSSSGWVQQGAKLTTDDQGAQGGGEQCVEEAGEEPGECAFGRSVALSADGNTALIGSPSGNESHGSAWVFTRSGSEWSLQRTLVGPNQSGEGRFAKSVALSADGNTALIGNPSADGGHGAAWVFSRSGSSWSTEGEQLLAGERSQRVHFGRSVALSADGQRALIGDPGEAGYSGSAWALARSGPNWIQQGDALRGSPESGAAHVGIAVALSGDGATALIGGYGDGGGLGAAWAFARSGSVFFHQGGKLIGANMGAEAHFGYSVALSGDGETALIGAPRDNGGQGAVRVFTRAGVDWSEQTEQLAGTEAVSQGRSGASVALSGDAKVGLFGAPRDERRSGAAWGFVDGSVQVPSVSAVAPNGGPAEGGTRVRITGTNFTKASAVSFGSLPAASFVVKSAVEIEAVSPAAPEGTVDVTVGAISGTSAVSEKARFTFGPSARSGTSGAASPAGTGSTARGGVLGSSASVAGGCRISLSKKRLAVARHRSVALRLVRTGTGACRGSLALSYRIRAKGRGIALSTIGTASFSIPVGQSRVVTVRLSRLGQALLRAHHGKFNASLAIVRVAPAPALAQTASVRLSVKKTPRATGVKR